jgi:hypothetical protein
MAGETAREQATSRALDLLPAGQWRAMYDVRCPARRVANLDHIVVGRAGVFVIDSRDWSGNVEVHANVLSQDGNSRGATVNRVADAALAVAEVTGLDPAHVTPVLCFDREESVAGWVHDVLICTTGNVVEQLTSQRRVWDEPQVEQTFSTLTWSLPGITYTVGEPSGQPRRGHRREGPARKRPALRKRSTRRMRRARGEKASTVVRVSLMALVACLVLVPAIGYAAARL